MASADQAFISGTTLAQLIGAAYACSSGCKHVYQLYGLRQIARELTDKPESAEKKEVVVVTAGPVDAEAAPSGLSNIGYLIFCQAPVHKLSYADTQRLRTTSSPNSKASTILLHFTKVVGDDAITRVFYTLYECSGSNASTFRPLKLNVDNLVDSLQGFTKISSVFSRNTPSLVNTGTSPNSAAGDEKKEVEAPSISDVESLTQEKASLIKRIVELTEKMSGQSTLS